ncbi:hypothetical protein Acsp04_28490 [Actinomadura sp. NBRC 104425]|uniref:hypothetical protein n=1 Tax=Actinomadura sp. NBRC 104425 TaxID=3032204 RepID=UPI0024A3605E|nr:hypothetical protein [Actinomadura sp. NBRC 104425]GLZ12614.1 hypothetical protein Acsp04_28490 [Actinomadura sp. NBRC 104425]
MDETLAGIIGRWPGRWRHPLLVAELARTPAAALDDDRVAGLVLAGLAAPATEAEGVRRLIKDGEFTAVEAFLAQATGDAGEWSRDVPGLLEDARKAARAEVAREAAVLRERAERIGLAPADLSDAETAAGHRRAEARRMLDAEKQRLRDAEDALAAELRSRLDGPQDPRAEALEACLAAGEPAAAQWLLDNDRGDTGPGGPRTVPRAPRWPWYGHTAAEALSWYDDGAQLPFPQLDRFVRARRDPGAAAVLDRLRALAAHPDAAAAETFATALSEFLGGTPRPAVQERDGGFATTLDCLDDTRLPRLSLLRGSGVPLWIADADTPPPADLTPPIIWFVPGNAEELTAPAGTAVLDIPGLLCLLAPADDHQPTSVPYRRVNLLRALVPQLGLDAVTDPAGGLELNDARPRESLAWLLDLLGIGAHAVVLDALTYETGRHPLAVPAVLAPLLDALRDRGAYELVTADLEAIRTPEARARLRTLLLAPLDAAQRAVLGLAGALFPSAPFDAAELASCAHLVGLPEETDPEQILQPVTTADALVTAHFLEHVGDQYRLAQSGIGDLVRGGAGWNPAEFAAEALTRLH